MDDLRDNVPPLIHNAGAEKNDIKKQRFAYLVQKMVYAHLTEKFGIDLSDSAIVEYANKKFNNVFNPTEEQIHVAEIYIQALREIVEANRSSRDVYDEYFMDKTFYDDKANITFDEWEKRVKIFAKPEIIKALEADLKTSLQGATSEKLKLYRGVYIESQLESAYCEQKDISATIVANLSASIVTKKTPHAEQLIRQECKKLFYPWVLKYTMDKVKVIDSQYDNYEIYLPFYSIAQFIQGKSK